jgi:hypothetical protein
MTTENERPVVVQPYDIDAHKFESEPVMQGGPSEYVIDETVEIIRRLRARIFIDAIAELRRIHPPMGIERALLYVRLAEDVIEAEDRDGA